MITPKQAIEYLMLIADNEAYTDRFRDACSMAIEALESRVQKKPVLISRYVAYEWQRDRKDWVCPVCGWCVGRRVNDSQTGYRNQREGIFCLGCGQKIDWSEN